MGRGSRVRLADPNSAPIGARVFGDRFPTDLKRNSWCVSTCKDRETSRNEAFKTAASFFFFFFFK